MSDVRKIFYWLKVHNFQGESQSQVCRNETIKSGEFKRMRHILGIFHCGWIGRPPFQWPFLCLFDKGRTELKK